MKRRILWVLLALVVALLCVEVLTYLLFAKDRVPVLMVRELFGDPPQSGPRGAGFVCVSDDTWASLSDSQRRALDRALSRYYVRVYHGKAEIPSTEWGGVRGGLRNGFILSYEVKSGSGLWFTASYSSWRDGLSAWGHTASFLWLPWGWVRTWQSPQWVS